MSEKVRPSSLPKLACCRAFQNAPGTSPAAERGTKLDGIIRRAWIKWQARCNETHTYPNLEPDDIEEYAELEPDDLQAVEWCLNTMREIACFDDIITEEHLLQAVVPVEGVAAGTMDALCGCASCVIDFKTGQERDYKAQMAAYALACMDMFFTDTWTARLLFIDQQKVVTHFFHEDEARELVQGIVNAPVEPTACEYCSWCAQFGSCPVTRTQVAQVQDVAKTLPAPKPAALSQPTLPPALEEMVENEALAHQFLSAVNVVNDWADELKARIKKKLKGKESDYFKMVVTTGQRKVYPLKLSHYMDRLGHQDVLAVCQPIPLAKVQEIFNRKMDGMIVPDTMIVTLGGNTQLRLRKLDKKLPATA